ncbi:MAG: Na+/H+ antiporter NhaC family protein, partial [Bacteroidota bacterium]|nr:Na+/H+ antiporter NhaC family protein [Bacteroidota bacterium]
MKHSKYFNMAKGYSHFILFFLLINASFQIRASEDIIVEKPEIVISGIEAELRIIFNNDSLLAEFQHNPIVYVNNKHQEFTVSDNIVSLNFTFSENRDYSISVIGQKYLINVNPIPLWLSILPPLIAILIALTFREVFTALLIGILFGAAAIFYYQGSSFFISIFQGMFAVVDTYILYALNNTAHLSIIIFSMLIGAMVNLISTNGGMQGVVRFLSKYAKTPRSGQFITWLLGIAIFFDDYANTLVVGNTMRPVCDRLKISREKLSYIVDSTAAPVAAIAFVTTWIGAEISYIEDGLRTIGLDESPYHVFINSLAYSFYPVLALLFIVLLIWQKRDFGPMYKAEVKARNSTSNNNEDQNKITAKNS